MSKDKTKEAPAFQPASQSQIEKWKEDNNGKVAVIEVDVDEYGQDVATCYLKRPSRRALEAAATVAQRNPIKASEILLKDMWLDGDPRILEDDELLLAVNAEAGEFINSKRARLKKL